MSTSIYSYVNNYFDIQKYQCWCVCDLREKIGTVFLDVILRDEDVRRDCVTS